MTRFHLRYLATVFSIAVIYLCAAKLSLLLALTPQQVTAVWPPAGIALVAYVMLGYRVWPGIFLGALIANATTEEPFFTATCIAAGNTLAGIVGLALLRHSGGFGRSLERVRDVLGLVIGGGMIGSALSATNGVMQLAFAGLIPWSAFSPVWWVWWLGDTMGVLLVAPFLLTWLVRRTTRWDLRRLLELAMLGGLVALICGVAFWSELPASGEPLRLEYLVFPFIVWAALRFGQREAATLVLLISGIALWTAVREQGPFGSGALDQRLLLLQMFMTVSTVTGLTLGAVVAERRRAEDALQEERDRLEARVKERTRLFEMISEYGSDMLAKTDASGVIRAVSPACRKILGYAPEELIGTRTVDLFPVDGRQEGGIAQLARARRKDGRYVWLESNRYVFRDPQTNEVLESIGLCRDITERVAFEEKLASEQRRLAAAEQMAHLGAWEWNVEADEILFSDELGRIFGLHPAFFGASFSGLLGRVHPHDRQHFNDAAFAALRAKGAISITARIIKPSGEVRIVDIKGEVVTDASGAPTQMMGTCQDVTEQRQAEEALQRQTARNESLLRAQNELGEGVAVTEGERLIYVNEAFAAIYGYTVEELYALPSFLPIIAPEEREEMAERLRLRERGEGVERNETVILRKDGQRVNIEYAVKPIRVTLPTQMFTIVRDITEQKRAADARRFLADIVDSSEDAIIGATLDGRVWSWNRGAERLYGYTAAEILGQSLEQILPPERVHEHRAHLEQIRRGESVAPYEAVRRRKDGSELDVAVAISGVRNARGQLIGFSKVIRDITQEKEAQRTIEASLREKEVLLKEIHHRVKNNLQVISSLLSLQSRHVDSAEARASFLESDARVKSIALVHEKLYQAESLASIEFEGYLRSLTGGLTHAFGAKHRIDVSAPHLQLPIDAAIPSGLIVNELVSNCFKHAFPDERAGHISVSLQLEPDQHYVLEVRDDGVGLPKELDFRKVPSMGLQLVNSLAKQLRGTLELVPGAGTCFRVRFPKVG